MLRHVDLCSGIGGFALGFEWANLSKPVLFCDIEPWCRNLLETHWPDVTVASDVKELANDPERFVPDCDILTAGYPCQPFSYAGLRKGAEDDRHIWPYIRKIVAQKRPAWCVFENVYGHLSLGIDQVLSDMEAEGYTTRTFIVPACSVGAPHKRDRVWIIAHTDNPRQSTGEGQPAASQEGNDVGRLCTDVAHTDSAGRGQGNQAVARGSAEQFDSSSIQSRTSVAYADDTRSQGRLSRGTHTERQGQLGHTRRSGAVYGQSPQEWWSVEPDVGRVAHGISRRVDRTKGLGNAIVPQIAQRIGLTIKEVMSC